MHNNNVTFSVSASGVKSKTISTTDFGIFAWNLEVRRNFASTDKRLQHGQASQTG